MDKSQTRDAKKKRKTDKLQEAVNKVFKSMQKHTVRCLWTETHTVGREGILGVGERTLGKAMRGGSTAFATFSLSCWYLLCNISIFLKQLVKNKAKSLGS